MRILFGFFSEQLNFTRVDSGPFYFHPRTVVGFFYLNLDLFKIFPPGELGECKEILRSTRNAAVDVEDFGPNAKTFGRESFQG